MAVACRNCTHERVKKPTGLSRSRDHESMLHAGTTLTNADRTEGCDNDENWLATILEQCRGMQGAHRGYGGGLGASKLIAWLAWALLWPELLRLQLCSLACL